MIIGFDAKRAFANHTGLGNYSRYIINNLSVYCPEHSYQLYAPKDTRHPDLAKIRQADNICVHFPRGLNRLVSSAWRTKFILNDLVANGVELYHGLSNEIPVGLKKAGIRSVVTVHDLIFLRYPGYYRPADRMIYLKKIKYACLEADHIVTVSECTQRDVISFFGVAPQKVSIIYQGCDASFHSPAGEDKIREVRKKYELPEKFILNVGTMEARKNLLLAVKAMRHIDADIHLVAVGKETAYTAQIKEFIAQHHLGARVRLLTGVPLKDLPAIYQSSLLFVYPSFYEGFGIPVIEALYSGIPVVAAIGSCLLEAGGHHSIYVQPENEMALADAVKKIISNDTLRKKMIVEGKKHAFHFDDQLLAQQMIQLYHRVLAQ
ncbi:MAG: glycosyltransferase family 4 protein [Bacteroidales bacterium]|jgi:glycosyltransferase involved in cell wall biosynthesis|nr:glycosyltransferase family 4 protein [Bacteroidales bacterium]